MTNLRYAYNMLLINESQEKIARGKTFEIMSTVCIFVLKLM